MKVTGLRSFFINIKRYIKSHCHFLIALTIALILEALFIAFVLYYPLKVIDFQDYFGDKPGISNNISEPSVVTTLDKDLDKSIDQKDRITKQITEVTDRETSINKVEDVAEDISVDDTDDSQDSWQEQKSLNVSDSSYVEPKEQEHDRIIEKESDYQQTTPISTVVDQDYISDKSKSYVDESLNTPQTDRPRNQALPAAPIKRRVRKIIRRRKVNKKRAKRAKAIKRAQSIFSKESLDKARQEVGQVSNNLAYGNTSAKQTKQQRYAKKYAYVYERLKQEQMFSYKCRIGKVLQSEFARFRTPIIFPEKMNHYMPGKIIINRDGSVKDYICDSPTGISEFDKFVKEIIMQTKFRPLPKHYPYDTHEEPFNPSVQANAGTNVFRLYVNENRDYGDD